MIKCFQIELVGFDRNERALILDSTVPKAAIELGCIPKVIIGYVYLKKRCFFLFYSFSDLREFHPSSPGMRTQWH